MQAKIKVIYITGYGRSGSTLLNMLLDIHPQAIGVGEILHLSDYYLRNEPCSCGKEVNNCTVWGSLKKSGAHPEKITIPSFSKYWSLYFVKNIFKYLFKLPLSPELEHNAYENKLLFEALLKIFPGKKVIIDSSKNISRLLLLQKSNFFDVKVIHLVRDGKAVLFSRRRPIRAKIERNRRKLMLGNNRTSFNLVSRWVMLNLFISIISSTFNSYKRVRYEDICDELEKSLNNIFHFAGLKQIHEIQSKISQLNSHLVGGNQMRFNEIREVKYDSEYLEELNLSDRIVFNIIGGPLNKFYGYHLNSKLQLERSIDFHRHF